MTNRLDGNRAIETAYRGFQFRSRLEAKWAVFFDLCGWIWSYEPIDLPGWIPDFAIGETHTLVEVKPFFEAREWGDTIAKVERSGWSKPVVLLGADPTGQTFGHLLVGGDRWTLDFGFTQGNNKLALCSPDGPWWNPIWTPPPNHSHPNKWSRVDLTDDERETCLVRNWATACNSSRWIPIAKESRP